MAAYSQQQNGGAGPHGATPPVRRMTYGAPQPGQEQAARAELFAGAGPAASMQQQQQQQQPAGLDDMDNQQLMQHAVATHKDTTATTRRALQIVEQTKEIQASTFVALKDQGDQMQRIEQDMDKIGEDLSYSERILRFMKLCCCFGFFCSCCTEPSRNTRDQKWRGSGAASQKVSYPGPQKGSGGQAAAQQRGGQQQQHAASNGAAAYPGVSTRGLDEIGFGAEAGEIQAETAQQDQYLDEISKGLDQLKFGAQRMNDELRFQEAHVDRIRTDADALETKLHAVNREGFRRI